jgi:hypothetical protein
MAEGQLAFDDFRLEHEQVRRKGSYVMWILPFLVGYSQPHSTRLYV